MGMWDKILSFAGGEYDLLQKAATVVAADRPAPGSDDKKPERRDAAAALARAVGFAPAGAPAAPGQAWNLDPWDPANILSPEMQSTHGTNSMSPEALRYLARMPMIDAILSIMIGDIARFHVPQPHRFAPGYTFAMRDPDAKPSKAAKKRIQELKTWASTCGDPALNTGVSFEAWARKSFRDSFILDAFATEVRTTRGGKIAGFEHVDAGTIYRAKPSPAAVAEGRRDPNDHGFVQVVGNRKVAEFAATQLIYGVRRPRGDLRVNGYGYPELEILVRYITYLLNAELFNAANFTNGVHNAGVGVFKSKMSDDTFRAFERKWYALLDGAAKAKKVPMVRLDPEEKEDFKFVSMGATNKEMEFVAWINHVFQGICFVYGIDAAELGKVYGNEGQKAAMSSASGDDKIAASKERWRNPVLRAAQGWLNTSIFWRIDPDFEFQYVGLNPETEAARLDAMQKSGKTHKSVNELRALDDLEPLPLPEKGSSPADWGPLEPTYISAIQQAMAARDAPAEGAGGDMGAGGAPGGPDGGGPGAGADDKDGDEAGSDLPTDFDVDAIFGKSKDKAGKGKLKLVKPEPDEAPEPTQDPGADDADEETSPEPEAPRVVSARDKGKQVPLKKGFAILREVEVEM